MSQESKFSPILPKSFANDLNVQTPEKSLKKVNQLKSEYQPVISNQAGGSFSI
jgi:hypothetical protein